MDESLLGLETPGQAQEETLNTHGDGHGDRRPSRARRALNYDASLPSSSGDRKDKAMPSRASGRRESVSAQALALSVPVIILSIMIAIRGVSFGHLLLPTSLSPALEAAGAQHAGTTLFLLSTAIGQLFFFQHSGVPFASSGAAFELLPLVAGVCARVLEHPAVRIVRPLPA